MSTFSISIQMVYRLEMELEMKMHLVVELKGYMGICSGLMKDYTSLWTLYVYDAVVLKGYMCIKKVVVLNMCMKE